MLDDREIVFEAQRRSRCLACDEDIVEGDEIVRDPDGEWIHLDCADDS